MANTALRLYVTLLILFLIFPIFLVVPISFSATRYLTFPPPDYSLRWYQFLLENEAWKSSAMLSFGVALGATAVAVPVGALAAYVIAQRKTVPGRLLSMLSFGPQIIPSIIIALGGLLVISKLGLYGSVGSLVIVHATLGLPFVLMIVTPAFSNGIEQYVRAARSLGASPLKATFTVVVPQALPAILSAAVLVFFISFDELIIAMFLMGGSETLPMRIWSDLRNELTPAVAAVSTLLIILTLMAIIPVEFYRAKKGKTQ